MKKLIVCLFLVVALVSCRKLTPEEITARRAQPAVPSYQTPPVGNVSSGDMIDINYRGRIQVMHYMNGGYNYLIFVILTGDNLDNPTSIAVVQR